MRARFVVLCAVLLVVIAITLARPADVPSSPYIGYVYRYADTMLEKGRDNYGPERTGLFLSALNRTTLAPLDARPAPPAGIRRDDRDGPPWEALVGSNPHHDQNLLRVLYVLSGLSGESKYADAADAELKWFLTHAASPETKLFSWGEHMYWNTMTDEPNPKDGGAVHEFYRPWVLWDHCFELAPDACKQFATALWEHQIANHEDGGFDRHATYWRHGPRDNMDFPRHAGFYIRTWADAYAHTKDEAFLHCIDVILKRYERKRHPKTGLIEFRRGTPDYISPQMLSLAIDCAAAAKRVPQPLAVRLQSFADREDELFFSLPHNIGSSGGFVLQTNQATGDPARERSSLWEARYGGAPTATIAMMCVSRYESSGKVGYRELIVAAADAYLESHPLEGVDVCP